jgi:Arc/MetJ-type ribon-helix-helix transcriptional regulator
MIPKQRLSVSVDSDLVEAAEAAAGRGEAASVSAWVNDALRLKLEHERRLGALADLLEAYERLEGVITDAEIAQATRRARSRAATVRTIPVAAPRTVNRRRKKR